MGAAVSLGITRFAYGLLLPPMRLDLGWSYALAGAMNTSNAAGYLLGALSTPLLLRRFDYPQARVEFGKRAGRQLEPLTEVLSSEQEVLEATLVQMKGLVERRRDR